MSKTYHHVLALLASDIQSHVFYSPKKSCWHQNLVPKLVHDPLPGTYGIERIWAPMKEPPPMASTRTLHDAYSLVTGKS